MGEAVPLPGTRPRSVPEELFAEVFGETIAAVESADVPYLVVGGVGSAALGRPRWTQDIDILVAPSNATRSLEALAAAGFDTERTNEHWIFKAQRHGVIVDVIFKLVGDIYIDDEMLARARKAEFLGVKAQVAAPEDQVVIKAIAHDEQSSRHWNDALSLLASCDIDWEYLIERACKSPRRVLSLLTYAQSDDLVVPTWAVHRLFAQIYGDELDVG